LPRYPGDQVHHPRVRETPMTDPPIALLAMTAVLLTAGCATQEEPEAASPTTTTADGAPADGTPSQQPGGTPPADGARDTAGGHAPDFSDPSVVTTGLDTPWSLVFHRDSAL